MKDREQRPTNHHSRRQEVRVYPDFAEIRSSEDTIPRDSSDVAIDVPPRIPTPLPFTDHIFDAPIRTLSPVSSNAMNALSGSPKASKEGSKSIKSTNGTIRSVPAEPLHLPSSATEDARSQSRPALSTMPHSTTLSYIPHSQPPLTHQNSTLNPQRGLVRQLSSEFGAVRSLPNGLSDQADSNGNGAANGDAQWSSAIGRANLGKSGRVIEKLMADNDSLRRELKVERLKADESKQAVKNLQEQMQSTAEANQGKLHDAAVTKTLLRRKERQVEDLTTENEALKQRLEEALQREQDWKDEAERVRQKAQGEVEEAKTHAMMLEGRVNVMAQHWKDQEKIAIKAVKSAEDDVREVNKRILEEAERANKLIQVCDQQDLELENVQKVNRELREAHERYKEEQERGLKDIKEESKRVMEVNERMVTEAGETLGRLKWALGVKENLRN